MWPNTSRDMMARLVVVFGQVTQHESFTPDGHSDSSVFTSYGLQQYFLSFFSFLPCFDNNKKGTLLVCDVKAGCVADQ